MRVMAHDMRERATHLSLSPVCYCCNLINATAALLFSETKSCAMTLPVYQAPLTKHSRQISQYCL